MGQFKPMVKMFTDEPSVILKLKKGGNVKAAGQAEGFKSMSESCGPSDFEQAEKGASPKKPSMAERRKAMNPNQYAKGGKVAHKQMGGAMPMVGVPTAAQPTVPVAPSALGRAALTNMAPAQRMARAAMVRKALTGMKKGGSTAKVAALEKELHHHEALEASKAHGKASGGAIDKAETKTTIKGNAGKFAKTKMDTSKKDKASGTGDVKEGKPGGYAKGGFVNTKMHDGDKTDRAHGTGGIKVSNAGGFKKGGEVWENRPANSAKPGVKDTSTGEVKEANAGGYKKGGAAKKAYATGGNVISDGKAEKMPRHFVSRPVANSLQSGTFKKGGKVAKYATGGSQKNDYDPDDFYDEYEDSDGRIHTRVKSLQPRYSETAVNKAIASSTRSGRKISGKEAKAIHGLLKGRYADGGEVEDLSKGAYDKSIGPDQEDLDMAQSIRDIPSRAFRGLKSMLGFGEEAGAGRGFINPPRGSVTKTKESVTVAPKKRGGKC